jgi:serine/threonine-protein kinase
VNTSSSRRVARLVAETVSASPTNQGTFERPSAPEESPYLAGEVIGDRYRLVREIGRGGMGVVWVAHSLVLGVDVALKLIRASIAGPALSSRMAREAHAAARLGHPALVRVFDFGWTGRGDPFLVMELVQGETLSALLDRDARLTPIRAVQMLLPIADGLRLAHEKEIVHRDIKPDNIFIAADAFGRVQPKLLDFGIAKVEHGTGDGKLTQFGAVLGSPEYMSPEQALGAEEVDGRTDVWSFCVVLYQVLTGEMPFRRPNYNALMHAIINDEPAPTTDLGVADAGLWAVIQRGLSKKRERRWPSVSAVGEALALWLYEHGIKEDISGNSIRAVWLDAGLTSSRIELVSSAAPRPTSARDRGAPALALLRSLEPRPQVEAAPHALVRPSTRSPLLAGIALGGLTAGVLVALALRPASSAAPAADKAHPSAPGSARMASAVRAPAPNPEPPAEKVDAAASNAPAAATANARAASSGPISRGAARASGQKQPLPRAPAPAPRRAKRNYDFGF